MKNIELVYGDKVVVVKGFLKGQKGIVVDKWLWYYEVDLPNLPRNIIFTKSKLKLSMEGILTEEVIKKEMEETKKLKVIGGVEI